MNSLGHAVSDNWQEIYQDKNATYFSNPDEVKQVPQLDIVVVQLKKVNKKQDLIDKKPYKYYVEDIFLRCLYGNTSLSERKYYKADGSIVADKGLKQFSYSEQGRMVKDYPYLKAAFEKYCQ